MKWKKILTLHICNQKNHLSGLTSKWVIFSIFNGLMMSQEEIFSILLNILYFLGYLWRIPHKKKSKKRFIEIFWKIWEATDQNNVSSISYKNILPIMNRNFLMSIILEHIILPVQLSSTTWSGSDPFLSDQWLFKVENLTVLIEFSVVMLVHGTMLQIHQPISENLYLKFTLFLKCLSI